MEVDALPLRGNAAFAAETHLDEGASSVGNRVKVARVRDLRRLQFGDVHAAVDDEHRRLRLLEKNPVAAAKRGQGRGSPEANRARLQRLRSVGSHCK